MRQYLVIALIIVAVSFSLFGCSSDGGNSPKPDENLEANGDSQITSQQEDKEEPSVTDSEEHRQELSTSFSIQSVSQETYNGLDIKRIKPEYPKEDYFLSFVNKVGSNLLVGLKSRKENLPELSLISYNLETSSQKEIFKGKGSLGFYSDFKLLDDGKRLVLEGRDRFFFLDKDSLGLLKEIKLPEDIYQYDISFDGSKIAYVREGSLYVANIDFSKPQLLVEGTKNNDPNSDFYEFFIQHPIQPKWSHDGTKILYIFGTYESSEGVGIVSSDGSSKHIIKREMFEPTGAAWFFNDEKIFVTQAMGESKIYIIDLAKSGFEYIKETSWPEYSSPSPTENKFIYEGERNKYDDPAQFYMVDSSGEYPITPLLGTVHGATWGPSGNEVVILADEQILIVMPKELLLYSREELPGSKTPADHIELSPAEELKWMEFSKNAFNFQEFSRDSEIDENTLIHDTAFYLVFRYKGEDRDQVIERKDGFFIITKETIDRFSQELFGRKIKKHQSVMGFDLKNGKYYAGGMDDHGYKLTHIQKFEDNKDGTYTIEYDFYYVNEGDESPLLIKPEEFIYEIHKEPQKFPDPTAKGKLLIKKITEDNRERYIIIENIKFVF